MHACTSDCPPEFTSFCEASDCRRQISKAAVAAAGHVCVAEVIYIKSVRRVADCSLQYLADSESSDMVIKTTQYGQGTQQMISALREVVSMVGRGAQKHELHVISVGMSGCAVVPITVK